MQIEILPPRWTNPAAEQLYLSLLAQAQQRLAATITPPGITRRELAARIAARLEEVDPLLQLAAALYSRYTVPVCLMTG